MIFVTVGVGGSDEIVKQVDVLASKSNEKFIVILGQKKICEIYTKIL